MPDMFSVSDRTSTTRHLDPLRTIGSYTEAQLLDEDYLRERTGAEVISCRNWQSTHRDVTDTALFEFLLRDAVEAHLVFYREHKGYSDDEAFIEGTLDASGTAADHSAKNVVETWEWLQTVDVPETLGIRQASFAAFASE